MVPQVGPQAGWKSARGKQKLPPHLLNKAISMPAYLIFTIFTMNQ